MSLQVNGKIEQILDPVSGVSRAGNEWKKQEFVIETNDKFPRKICFTLFNDKESLLQNVSQGDEVEVSFNIESREFNGKWYHNINAWKIEKVTEDHSFSDAPPEYQSGEIPPEAAEDEPGDLPF